MYVWFTLVLLPFFLDLAVFSLLATTQSLVQRTRQLISSTQRRDRQRRAKPSSPVNWRKGSVYEGFLGSIGEDKETKGLYTTYYIVFF